MELKPGEKNSDLGIWPTAATVRWDGVSDLCFSCFASRDQKLLAVCCCEPKTHWRQVSAWTDACGGHQTTEISPTSLLLQEDISSLAGAGPPDQNQGDLVTNALIWASFHFLFDLFVPHRINMGTWVEKKGNIMLWLIILALVEGLAGSDEVETTVLHEVQSPWESRSLFWDCQGINAPQTLQQQWQEA